VKIIKALINHQEKEECSFTKCSELRCLLIKPAIKGYWKRKHQKNANSFWRKLVYALFIFRQVYSKYSYLYYGSFACLS